MIWYVPEICCATFDFWWLHNLFVTSAAVEHACYGEFILITIQYLIFVYWWFSCWRHQMEIFPALLAICAGNSPVCGEFPAQRPATRSFDVFFGLCLNKRLSKQSRGWWFETLYRPLWRHCNVHMMSIIRIILRHESEIEHGCLISSTYIFIMQLLIHSWTSTTV